MEEKRYQTATFTIEPYKWGHSKEEARDLMWKDISTFLAILLKNNNIAVIFEDEVDIIVIQYEHDERIEAWGLANPHWITDDERFNCIEESKISPSDSVMLGPDDKEDFHKPMSKEDIYKTINHHFNSIDDLEI